MKSGRGSSDNLAPDIHLFETRAQHMIHKNDDDLTKEMFLSLIAVSRTLSSRLENN